MILYAPVSWADLIDRITILEIKSERLTNVIQRRNISVELELLVAVLDSNTVAAQRRAVEAASLRLKEINTGLWNAEDAIRLCERSQQFDARFVELARQIYRLNDKRAALKRRLNQIVHSEIVEEKSYPVSNHQP